jgi:hypothetical protein
VKKYWISWYHLIDYSDFELDLPWWSTGWRCSDEADTICAGIIANSSEDAEERIYRAYDERPLEIEFRFVDLKSNDWSPFGSRFVKREWMRWPEAV